MLVVMEGLDGSGKSTQVRNLQEYLASRCPGLDYLHFPRYDAPVYGDLISRFLRGDFGPNASVHPLLVALLFAEDRHGAGPRMKETLAGGGTLLLDRYVYSNVAYQCAKLSDDVERESLKRWILDTEYGIFSLPKPDLNLFLDVPVAFVERRLEESRKGADRDYLQGAQDIHESDMAFQRQVRSMYLQLAEADPNFIRIDCSGPGGRMLSPEEAFEKIKIVVDSYVQRV